MGFFPGAIIYSVKRYEKGEYEYASYSKVSNWIITIVMYALSAAIYTIGIMMINQSETR